MLGLRWGGGLDSWRIFICCRSAGNSGWTHCHLQGYGRGSTSLATVIIWLVVWNMNFMTFHSLGNGIIIPTDFHSMIFQRGRYTTNQILIGILSPWVENHQPEYYVHRFSIKKGPWHIDPHVISRMSWSWMVFLPTGTTILNHSRNMNPYFWVNSNDRTLFSRSLE